MHFMDVAMSGLSQSARLVARAYAWPSFLIEEGPVHE